MPHNTTLNSRERAMHVSIERLQTIVISAAREELLPRFAQVKRSHKSDGSILTEADLAMHRRLQQALQQEWPHYRFMGEEMDSKEQEAMLRDTSDGVWCLDPLDGTSNFAAGIPYFSVSLSLIKGGEVVVGLVYDPTRDECFSAARGEGALLNGRPLETTSAPSSLKKCTALIDFKRLSPAQAQRLVSEMPYGSQRSFGSVALDWCWIAAGRCHVYLHGKQNIWDYSAGHLILHEAGGYSTTLGGESVFRPTLTARSALAARDPALFQAWVQWFGIEIDEVTPQPPTATLNQSSY